MSHISRACSPVSGWDTSTSSMSTPMRAAYTGSSACSASMKATMPQLGPAPRRGLTSAKQGWSCRWTRGRACSIIRPRATPADAKGYVEGKRTCRNARRMAPSAPPSPGFIMRPLRPQTSCASGRLCSSGALPWSGSLVLLFCCIRPASTIIRTYVCKSIDECFSGSQRIRVRCHVSAAVRNGDDRRPAWKRCSALHRAKTPPTRI